MTIINWFRDQYSRSALFKLCANTLKGVFIIELTLFLLKLVVWLFAFLNGLLSESSSNEFLKLAISKDELIRIIDDVAFVTMFIIYIVFEILDFLKESIKKLNAPAVDATTTLQQ